MSSVKKKGGNTYFVIGSGAGGGSGGGSSESSTKFVANIAERNALDNPAGMVFVKDATGDSTVDRGWAIYIHDGKDWIKIIEEESVNGMWSVRNEIKKTIVTKRELSEAVGNLNHTIQEIVEEIGKIPSSIDEPIAQINESEDWSETTIVTKLNELITTINTLFAKS